MPVVKIKVDVNGDQVAREMHVSAENFRGRVLNSIQSTMEKASREILDKGRADISGAGNFGSRWTNGLQVAEDFGPEVSTLTVFHTVPYWRIFEVGGTIKGKPLLWIPLSGTDAEGQTAREYGGLFRVTNRAGLPLLLSRADRQPKFFGKESVHIPKKFHLIEIATEIGGKMLDYFQDFFSKEK